MAADEHAADGDCDGLDGLRRFSRRAVERYFDDSRMSPVVKHQTDTFNDFVLTKIQHVVDGFNDIDMYHLFQPSENRFKYHLRTMMGMRPKNTDAMRLVSSAYSRLSGSYVRAQTDMSRCSGAE
jgi:hypothetical protein